MMRIGIWIPAFWVEHYSSIPHYCGGLKIKFESGHSFLILLPRGVVMQEMMLVVLSAILLIFDHNTTANVKKDNWALGKLMLFTLGHPALMESMKSVPLAKVSGMCW